MPNIDQKRGRRRSASESDGDPLNSLTNPPLNLFNSNAYTLNVERCVSNPHINTTGLLMIHIEIVLVQDLRLEL